MKTQEGDVGLIFPGDRRPATAATATRKFFFPQQFKKEKRDVRT
jgi:hypothetical protein